MTIVCSQSQMCPKRAALTPCAFRPIIQRVEHETELMSGIGTIAVLGWWTLAIMAACAENPNETALFFFGPNEYSAAILDMPRTSLASKCPELFQPPAIGDSIAFRVFRRGAPVREIAATVVASDLLECADGPEIAIHPGQLRLDLLRALYLTDALHRTPQTGGEAPPVPPIPQPTIHILAPP